ncbi:putative sensory transducer protein YvaQ [Paraliobacillus quinghaiensis]|uniref:Sensory transducer protein YvaQ n=1 Tax=Paraliobacillus quinghaiensis TaxID=470815 RepID=A0A917TNI1_9BACI|nr:HAMP domain-containing methyl-accepting chemotaxis protein [Paraliobacillus quinghaiensis]GGM29901.1 putative sensory transducer protein YvaQ [Paraliobacillus quinghaiensis]
MRKLGSKLKLKKAEKPKITNKEKKKVKARKVKGNGNFGLKNVKIGQKFGIIFLFIFLLLGISTGIVANSMSNASSAVDTLERRGDLAITITEISSQVRGKTIMANQYIQFGGSNNIQKYYTEVDEVNQLFEGIRDQLDTDEQINILNEVETRNTEMDRIFKEEITEAYSQDNNSDLRFFSNNFNNLTIETMAYFDLLVQSVNEERQSALDNTHTSQDSAMSTLVISMVVSIVIGIIMILLISRNVSKNLNKVVVMSDEIADGNLSVEPLSYQSKDEIGKLAKSMNTMQDNLKQIVQNISGTATTVGTQSEELSQAVNEVRVGSEQIAATMEELASGTETQANYAGDLSQSMKDFVTHITQANKNGEEINGSAGQVLSKTEEGNQLMATSVKQMGSIDAIVKEAVEKVRGLDVQSGEISKLVSVIKDIADQTNLLALNAAIEAARAGEHGKGFAVVADEVRKLAEQVGASVSDITSIVTNIQTESNAVTNALEEGYQEVEVGTKQIKATDATFIDIKNAVNDMAVTIKTVTDGLTKMATESDKMNASIEEIASISEESAAGVEETSASSEEATSSLEGIANGSDELARSAEKLNDVVRQFKL